MIRWPGPLIIVTVWKDLEVSKARLGRVVLFSAVRANGYDVKDD